MNKPSNKRLGVVYYYYYFYFYFYFKPNVIR